MLLINSYLFKHISLNKKCFECVWAHNCRECSVFLILLLRHIWPQMHFHYGCFQNSGSECFLKCVLKSMADHVVCAYSLRGSEWFWCLIVHLTHFWYPVLVYFSGTFSSVVFSHMREILEHENKNVLLSTYLLWLFFFSLNDGKAVLFICLIKRLI